MTRTLFSIETEINASPKILFPYLNTPDGLEKWFADQVIEEDDTLIFVWDDEKHKAKRVSKKDNHFVKFECVEEVKAGEESAYIELKLVVNELTNSTFLIIEEFTEVENPEDLQEMYNTCFHAFKEIE